jgi:hypothetical protein
MRRDVDYAGESEVGGGQLSASRVAVSQFARTLASSVEVSLWRELTDEVKRYRNGGMRRSRADSRLRGCRHIRCNHQHYDYCQYRKKDIAVPRILLVVYAFPFFPFVHCFTPYCVSQYRL